MYIYKTTNLINNKIYIGQSTKKVEESKSYLGSGILLGNSIKKYGIENFKKEILCECNTQKQLDVLEEFYIKKFNCCDKKIGYNILPGNPFGHNKVNPMKIESVRIKNTELRKGRKSSEEAKRNMSKAHMGVKLSDKHKKSISRGNKGKIVDEETRKKIGNGNRGKKRSEEQCKRISEAGKGRIVSDETRKKLSEAGKNRYIEKNNPNIGKKASPETKKKMSDAHKLRIAKMTEEERKAMSKSITGKNNPMLGKTLSEETKKKIGESNRMRIVSDDTRKKMSEARKRNIIKNLTIKQTKSCTTIKK